MSKITYVIQQPRKELTEYIEKWIKGRKNRKRKNGIKRFSLDKDWKSWNKSKNS